METHVTTLWFLLKEKQKTYKISNYIGFLARFSIFIYSIETYLSITVVRLY